MKKLPKNRYINDIKEWLQKMKQAAINPMTEKVLSLITRQVRPNQTLSVFGLYIFIEDDLNYYVCFTV